MKYLRYIWLGLSLAASGTALLFLPMAKWGATLFTLAGIIGLVMMICAVTSILEYRCYFRYLGFFAMPLIRFGRLPEAGGRAFIASFASGSVAAMMLATEFKEKRLTRKEMRVCAFCCTVPPVLLFNCYLTLPVIGMIGMAGMVYFAFTVGILVTAMMILLTLSRFCRRSKSQMTATLREPCSWSETWRKTQIQMGKFMIRLLLLTTPFYLWTSCAIYFGWLNFPLPPFLREAFSPEMMAVLAARVGGLLAAAGSAAELLQQQRISVSQTVLVLLIGNVLNGITRMIRRGLPVSCGIYPGYDGALIVGVGTGLRIGLTALCVVILWRMAC